MQQHTAERSYTSNNREDKIRDEYQYSKYNWEKTLPLYTYLQYRCAYLERKGGSERSQRLINKVEAENNLIIPLLTPQDVDNLYANYVTPKAMECFSKFESHPMVPTSTELLALNRLTDFFSKHPKIKWQIKDTIARTKDGIPIKRLLGCHVPDLIILGLRFRGTKAAHKGIAFEINGICHVGKTNKDLLLIDHAKEMDIFIYPIENKDILRGSKLETDLWQMLQSGALYIDYNSKVIRNCDLNLKLKAISSWLTPSEIDEVYSRINPSRHRFNCQKVFRLFTSTIECPREIFKAQNRAILAAEEYRIYQIKRKPRGKGKS